MQPVAAFASFRASLRAFPRGALAPCELLWEHSMCADNVKGAEVRDLMGRAFRGPLVPAQQQQ